MSTRRPLPTFFGIGAAKSGTTWLHDNLADHPEVFVPTIKETGFFSNDYHYQKGVDWYCKTHFEHSGRYAVRGEVCPQYIAQPKVAERLRQLYEEQAPRFVVLLRDPALRAWSWHRHLCRNGWETLSFQDALRAEAERCRDPELLKTGNVTFNYFQSGCYADQLKVWFEHFPREAFGIWLYEDLRASPHDTYREILEHIGAPPDPQAQPTRRSNVASEPRNKVVQRVLTSAPQRLAKRLRPIVPGRLRKPLVLANHRLVEAATQLNLRPAAYTPPPAHTLRALRERFATQIEELAALIDRDLSAWLPDHAPEEPASRP